MATCIRDVMLEGTHVPLRHVITTGTGWNGFHVPVITAEQLHDYWQACRVNDPNGEWTPLPYVDAAGTLRLPSWEAPEDRTEDTTWEPCGTRRTAAGEFVSTYAVDGLLWVDYAEDEDDTTNTTDND